MLSRATVLGDIIAFANEESQSWEGKKNRYTFAGSVYFNRMKELGLYTIDKDEIQKRVAQLNLDGVFSKKLM